MFDDVDTDTTHDWAAVIQTVYDTITNALNATNKNQSNGLVPAWCTSDGAPNGGAFGMGQPTAPTNYQYDSCRTPFRIALDWCWFGTDRRARLRRQDQRVLRRRSARPTSSMATTSTARPARSTPGSARRRSSARPGSVR